MTRALLAVAVLAPMTLQAVAQTGAWTNYQVTDFPTQRPVCGIQSYAIGGSATDNVQFHLKVFRGNAEPIMQIWKGAWTIPAGTSIRIAIDIDERNEGVFTGWGEHGVIWLDSPGALPRQGFYARLQRGRVVTIRFVDGNEALARFNLVGFGGAYTAMMNCGRSINAGGRL